MNRPAILILVLALLTCAMPVYAEPQFVGVWHRDTGSNIITGPHTFSDFLEKGEDLTQQGLHLIDFDVIGTSAGQRVIGVWRSGTGTNLFTTPVSTIAFREQREDMNAEGLRANDFELTQHPNNRYSAIWGSGTGDELVSGGLQLDAFLSRGDRLAQDGLRLTDVEITFSQGVNLYHGLWHEGSGSNFFTAPMPRPEFIQKRNEMRQQGLRLVDLEVFKRGNRVLYAGVFRSGSGESRVSRPRTFEQFVELGADLTARGWRLFDVESVVVPPKPDEPMPSPPDGGSDDPGAQFPPLPEYIELTDARRVVVDFTLNTNAGFRITLPRELLPLLPTRSDGELLIPDKFCGLRIIKADRFVWERNGALFGEIFPPVQGVFEGDLEFNNIRELTSDEEESDDPPPHTIQQIFGDEFFLGGIDFTGPIGKCENKPEDWKFDFPFTKGGVGFTAPAKNLRLTIEAPLGRIEFLDSTRPKAKTLDAGKLFSDKYEKAFKRIVELFKFHQKIDSGFCGIDKYLMKVCEEQKPGDVDKCLLGEDFESPC